MSGQTPKDTKKIHINQMKETKIIDVWQYNFLEQIELISELIEEFNVIAMDTEFPGIQQLGNKNDNDDDKEIEYQQIRDNVKGSKIIQIGLSIANEEGYIPLPCSTWQFNFLFEEGKDKIMEGVLTLLKKAGINFENLRINGINPNHFADYASGAGLILNEDLKWIVFHGGFDFGYLIHMFHHSGLPETSEEFSSLMRLYFPQTYDLKCSLRENTLLRDVGLTKLAQKIYVERIGPEHQAGSDALLTLSCYFQLRQQPQYKNESNQIERQLNVIYGIGKGYVSNSRWKQFDPQINSAYDLNQFDASVDNAFNMYHQQYQFDYQQFYPTDQQQQYQYFQSMAPQQQSYFYNAYQQQAFNEQEGNNNNNNKKKMNY